MSHQRRTAEGRATRFLLDENLSEAVLGPIDTDYPGSGHVRRLLEAGASDEKVWRYARDNGFVLVTRDQDFERLCTLRGAPPKVIWLCDHNVSNTDVIDLLEQSRSKIEDFVADRDAVFMILGHRPRSQ